MAQRDGGPRKVVVGTAMHNMFGEYPGLDARLAELAGLLDRMAEQAREQFGAGLDIAALPEWAVNGGKQGPPAEVAVPLDGPVLDALGGKAGELGTYVVVPMALADDPAEGMQSNAAVLLDRSGQPAGVYRKVHLAGGLGSQPPEGGAAPGRDFPVFECDFGKVACQICYDMAYDDGWETLAGKGAELVIWPSQWPGQINPAARALHHGFYVLSSTWRNNACLVDPTGHVIREIRSDGVFVEQVDLEYVLLHWHASLLNGKAFDEAYGERAGYRYDPAEDTGIFWSNDPAKPIMEMIRELGLTPKGEQLERSRIAQDKARGGPPGLD
jgi:predicted amidohydrolase